MADMKDQTARSYNMSCIHGKNTKPELFIRHLLFIRGYRFRLHSKKVPGHPDLWLKKYNTAIFVNGCFWHRHTNCKYAYTPKSHIEFWEKKFSDNISRDNRNYSILASQGTKCLVLWECTIKKMGRDNDIQERVFRRIQDYLVDQNLFLEL